MPSTNSLPAVADGVFLLCFASITAATVARQPCRVVCISPHSCGCSSSSRTLINCQRPPGSALVVAPDGSLPAIANAPVLTSHPPMMWRTSQAADHRRCLVGVFTALADVFVLSALTLALIRMLHAAGRCRFFLSQLRMIVVFFSISSQLSWVVTLRRYRHRVLWPAILFVLRPSVPAVADDVALPLFFCTSMSLRVMFLR
jgi:hypothetical protein